jgi:hypothetical protein
MEVRKYSLLMTLLTIGAALLLMNLSIGVAIAQSSTPVGTTSGSKVIGTVQVNGQNLTIIEQWHVSAQLVQMPNTVYVYYYYYNTLSYTGCSPIGTDWNTQEGIVEVSGGSGGPIVYYLNPATTYQGYTGLGCSVAFIQTGNTATKFSNYVYYYTTGNVCFILFGQCAWNIESYYQISYDYNTGTMQINDWFS